MPKNLVEKIRGWWKLQDSGSLSAVPFAIPCSCGSIITGQRKLEYQIVPCPQCKAETFVLPISPLPRLVSPSESSIRMPLAEASVERRKRWLTPAALAGLVILTLLLLIGIYQAFFMLWPSSYHTSYQDAHLESQKAEKLAKDYLARAEAAVEIGHFAMAHEFLSKLEALQKTSDVKCSESRALAHRRKEMGLYADLLEQPVEELIQLAIDLPEEEWQHQFKKRYRGRSIVLDTTVRKHAGGALSHDYPLSVAGQMGTFRLDNAPFLQNLREGQTQRVIFGARLNKIHREKSGRWIIEFAPNSFLIMTDEKAFRFCCPNLDAGAVELLKQQRAVVEESDSPK